MNLKLSQGLLMAIIGFLMILTNAISYVFNLNFAQPALGIMGLIFVAIGMKIARKDTGQ